MSKIQALTLNPRQPALAQRRSPAQRAWYARVLGTLYTSKRKQMAGERFDKVYVHMIDGTDVWVPINAKWVRKNIYQILTDSEFDPTDTATLLEFVPGDTVKVCERAIGEQKNKMPNVATQLVYSTNADKRYFDFLFKSLTRQLPIDATVAQAYRDITERIREEITAGRFHYPDVVRTIEALTRIKE